MRHLRVFDRGQVMSNRLEKKEIEILRQIEEDADEQVRLDREILKRLSPRLNFIKLKFGGTMQGPVTLTVGQKTKATVVGFDQTGAVFTGTIPSVTYSIDNPALDSSTPDGSN